MKHRLVHLDCLRGLAALLVCAGHLRAFLLVQYPHIKSPGVVDRLFYFATGLGHQAVMIFFVLSGFLVGGSVITAHQNDKWSWTGYALRRLTRLWVVLIPALLLTLFWDGLGQSQSVAGYNGEYRLNYFSGPSLDVPADLRLTTFLGNGFFLQTISVNVYGTNGPLWSLANEFWYYLLFPLLLGVLAGRRWLPRLVCALFAVVFLFWLPGGILMGGAVWLFGMAAFLLAQNQATCRWVGHPLWLLGSGLLTMGLLVANRVGILGGAGDLLLGGGCALLVAGLVGRPAPPSPPRTGRGQGEVSNPSTTRSFALYARLAAGVSEFSYTLYLVHFPILAFLFYSVFKGKQMQPGLHSAFWFVGILTAVLIYAALIWYCFERNTDRLRKRIEPFLFGGGASVPASR